MMSFKTIGFAEKSMVVPPAAYRPTFSRKKPQGRRPLVLVQSGDKDTIEMFRSLLEMWNYRAAASESVEATIVLAKSQHPDVVIMDSQVPFSRSLDSVNAIKECSAFADVPIILISGFSQTAYRQAALEQGFTDVVLKPVNFDLLEQCLATLTEKRRRSDGRELNDRDN